MKRQRVAYHQPYQPLATTSPRRPQVSFKRAERNSGSFVTMRRLHRRPSQTDTLHQIFYFYSHRPLILAQVTLIRPRLQSAPTLKFMSVQQSDLNPRLQSETWITIRPAKAREPPASPNSKDDIGQRVIYHIEHDSRPGLDSSV